MNEQELLQTILKKIPHYEHTRLERISDHEKGTAEGDHLFENLKTERPLGDVISTYRDEEGKLHVLLDKISHKVILGGTGCGKTTGPILSELFFLAETATSSVIVNDPKGELYEKTASRFRERGYDVKLINFRDGKHSECWNPFYAPSEKYYRSKHLWDEVEEVKEDERSCYLFNGDKYSATKLEKVLKATESQLQKKARSTAKDVTAKLFPTKSLRDPFWEDTAKQLLVSLNTAMMDDLFSKDATLKTTIDQINFSSFINIFNSFDTMTGSLDDNGYFTDRGDSDFSYQQIKKNYFHNAENTFRCILGSVEALFGRYANSEFETITKTSSIHAEDFVKNKTVLFITYNETDVVNREFLSYFFASLLEELKDLADSLPDFTLPFPVYLVIDEFATLPANQVLSDFVAYGRSRNIFLHFVLQSYEQLKSRYPNDWKNILENCSTTLFLGSSDSGTLSDFSRSLGACTTIAPECILNENAILRLEERPVVTCHELSYEMQQGDAYVKRNGKLPLAGHFEKSYECKEYETPRSLLRSYQSSVDPFDDAYEYSLSSYLKKKDTLEDDISALLDDLN